ncbi:MAG: hypothetical protein LBO63_08570 [Oscillospiraceae bacterium]|nr:hypothetical protein [Oscillospiraceae bacterium]
MAAQTCRYARRRLLFSASPEKSNQKRGDFFVKKQTPFYTGTAVVGVRLILFPATYRGGRGERFRTAARRGEACRGVG